MARWIQLVGLLLAQWVCKWFQGRGGGREREIDRRIYLGVVLSDMEEKAATGSLYVLNFDGSAKEIANNITVCLSLSLSPFFLLSYYTLSGLQWPCMVRRWAHDVLY